MIGLPVHLRGMPATFRPCGACGELVPRYRCPHWGTTRKPDLDGLDDIDPDEEQRRRLRARDKANARQRRYKARKRDERTAAVAGHGDQDTTAASS